MFASLDAPSSAPVHARPEQSRTALNPMGTSSSSASPSPVALAAGRLDGDAADRTQHRIQGLSPMFSGAFSDFQHISQGESEAHAEHVQQSPSAWQGSSAPRSPFGQEILSRYRAASGGRTFRHPSGMMIGSGMAKAAGFKMPRSLPGMSFPLPATLEAVEHKSAKRSLPGWAKRASEKPMIRGSSDFLRALVKSDSTDDVIRVIFDRARNDAPSLTTLPAAATRVIEEIRKEAHTVQKKIAQQDVAFSRLSRDGKPRRRTSKTVKGFTGLKPISTAQTQIQQPNDDKVLKLAKRLEDLVLLAEDQQRNQARMGVRMAEDSSEAIEEGRNAPTVDGVKRDEKVDLDALHRDVFHAIQELVNTRRYLRMDSNDDFDGGW
jgi:hypothetical protein